MQFRAAIAWLLLTGVSAAAEHPYGSDGLPYFVANAEIIVQVGECSIAERGEYARIAHVQVKQTLRGDIAPDARLDLLIHGTGQRTNADHKAVDDLSRLQNATLFLTVPLGAEELRVYGIQPHKQPIRALVSPFAVVLQKNDQQQRAMLDFLHLRDHDQASKIAWVRQNLVSEDPVLRRWALLEAGEEIGKGSLDLAQDLNTMAQKEANPALQPLVVTQLTTLQAISDQNQAAGPKHEASNGLVWVLANPQTSVSLKHRAYAAIPNQERRQVLSHWISENAEIAVARPVLTDIARLDEMSRKERQEFIAGWGKSDDIVRRQWSQLLQSSDLFLEMSDAQFNELKIHLQSKNAFERVSAIKEFSKYAPADRLLALASQTLNDDTESKYARSQTIDAIAAWESKAAIDLLSAFVSDSKRPTDLRINAIQAIARSAGKGSEDAKTSLKTLADTCEDKKLKALALTLSKS